MATEEEYELSTRYDWKIFLKVPDQSLINARNSSSCIHSISLFVVFLSKHLSKLHTRVTTLQNRMSSAFNKLTVVFWASVVDTLTFFVKLQSSKVDGCLRSLLRLHSSLTDCFYTVHPVSCTYLRMNSLVWSRMIFVDVEDADKEALNFVKVVNGTETCVVGFPPQHVIKKKRQKFKNKCAQTVELYERNVSQRVSTKQ